MVLSIPAVSSTCRVIPFAGAYLWLVSVYLDDRFKPSSVKNTNPFGEPPLG